MIDIMENRVLRHSVLDEGYVELMDVMPRFGATLNSRWAEQIGETCDYAIVESARVTVQGAKQYSDDVDLIRYLFRHRHTTPTEMIEFKFRCKMPIFVARQWVRHRMSSINEMSGRYSQLPDDFYVPDVEEVNKQSTSNRQGSEGKIGEIEAVNFIQDLKTIDMTAYQKYQKYLEVGIAKEQARMLLPLNLYTAWVWKIDLHNLFHFLGLRMDKHAQWEMKQFADAIYKLIEPMVPVSCRAFNDYHPLREAMLLSRLEVEALQDGLLGQSIRMIKSENKREQGEFVEKMKRLGIMVEGAA